jgi:squalene synthase HpnC
VSEAAILSAPTAPPSVRLGLAAVSDLSAAQAFTRELTHTHYENFSVISWFVPRHLRQDFCNIYAFCRIADDAGDEAGDPQTASALLADLKDRTDACYGGHANTALFVALSDTITRHDLPKQPLLDLIDAFQQDQRITRYQTFEQLLDYCRRSANPVGRIVLHLFGYRDEQRQSLSDQTCSALQLTNFWQDVRRDILDRDRIYLPTDDMARFGVTEAQIQDGHCDENYRRLIQFEVERTEQMFAAGDALPALVGPEFRRQITLFGSGGRAILAAIRNQGFDTLSVRPALSRWRKFTLACKLVLGSGGSAA